MDALSLTRDLVRFDTINPPGREQACARHVARLLEGAGFDVAEHEFGPGRSSLVARLGGGERPPLCFTGHLDVVPLGARPWSREPLAAEIDGDRLYGRGSSDMKSGVAAFVIAAQRLAPRLTGTPGLVLVVTAAEETGSQGAFRLAAQGGGVLGRAGAVVVAEPTGNEPLVGHKGALWLHARTGGVTAHGSMPERGVNAVVKAARAVLRLTEFDFAVPPHAVLGRPTLNVGTIAGGLNVNSVPDAASIGIDIRTIPGQAHAALRARLAAHLGEDVTLEGLTDVPGVWTDPADPWMQEVYEVVTPLLGRRPDVKAAPYVTDAAALTPAYGGAPTVILGPGELALAHQTDEWCSIERIEQAVDVYIELARRWCGL
jgi:succinyl-diaminopimelate desuccinylase